MEGTPPPTTRKRIASREPERFERRLGDVMQVLAADAVHVDGRPRCLRVRLDELGDDVDVEVVDATVQLVHRVHERGAASVVDDAAHQRLVERRVGVTEPPDAVAIAERVADRTAEDEAHVLDEVVRVDVDVATAADA